MKLFKKWKSRKVIVNERDHYKQMLEKERQETARLKQEKSDAEFEAQNLEADKDKLDKQIEALRQENERLKSENLAKLNIINEERRKSSKRIEQMKKRIEKMERQQPKDSGKKEENDLPFDKR
jgi:uncharacterized protein (DUF3084 family)